MKPFLWDDYKTDEVNEKIKYWVDLWESMIDSIDDPSFGVAFDPINPHLLVRHIIDEIIFNQFRNRENREYFKRQLEKFKDKDPATKKLISADMTLLRREFGDPRLEYLLQLCKRIEAEFSKNEYLVELYRALQSILSNGKWSANDSDSITLLSQCIIVELLLRGYSLESIKELPESILDRSSTFNLYLMDYSWGVKQEDHLVDGEFDILSYRAAIEDAAKAATVTGPVINIVSAISIR